jgi:pyridoxamine--pyruvate transaminase
MAVSERAWKKMKANPAAPRGSYLSILDWENAWSRETRFPSNVSVPLIYALDAALDLYLAEGPRAVWARHERTGKDLVGLELQIGRAALVVGRDAAFSRSA